MQCCEESCKVHSCRSGYRLKSDATKIIASDDDTCCEEDAASDPKLIMNVWLAVALSFVISVLVTTLIWMVDIILRKRQNPAYASPVDGNSGNNNNIPPQAYGNPGGGDAGKVATGSGSYNGCFGLSPTTKFIVTEVADLVTENAILIITWGQGDLNFSADGEFMKYILIGLNIFSIVAFLFELVLLFGCRQMKSDGMSPWWLYPLRLLHLGVEDLWQMLLFVIVGLSQALNNDDAPPVGIWVAALVQGCFALGARIYEFLTSN